MSEWTPLAHAADCRCSACDPTHPEFVVDALRKERDAATGALEGIAHHAPGRAGVVARDALVAMGVWNATVEADERPDPEVDALREENERLRKLHQEAVEILCQKDERVGTLRARVEELEVERDEARAEVERLGTALRRLCEEAFHAAAPMTDDGPPLLPALWRELQRANDAHMATGGGSQEPRPVAICDCCENPTTRPYVHPVEGIDLCAPCVAALPREEPRPDTTRPLLPESGESIRAAIDQHRDQVDVTDPCMSCDGTDGHHTAGCYWAPHEEPRPDTDETCPDCEKGKVGICPAHPAGRRPDTKET